MASSSSTSGYDSTLASRRPSLRDSGGDGSTRPGGQPATAPQTQLAPLAVASSSASASSSSSSSELPQQQQHLYSASSPVFSPSTERAPNDSSLPFTKPPSSDSPPIHPPSAAYISRSTGPPEPMGYTPLNDFSTAAAARSALKGKGRAKSQGWVDLERGRGQEEQEAMVREGWERVDGETSPGAGGGGASEYPPPLAMTEEEREEKRIAENLARMHEKEAARRRAARESKHLKSHAARSSAGSSVGRRNRWSIFGAPAAPANGPAGHIPLSYTGSPPPAASPMLSPTSSSYASSSSHTSQPPYRDSMSPTLPTASYQGREWIGGAQNLQPPKRRKRQLGFWENLCGTGRDRTPGEQGDDSDEDDNQVGRTNPFE